RDAGGDPAGGFAPRWMEPAAPVGRGEDVVPSLLGEQSHEQLPGGWGQDAGPHRAALRRVPEGAGRSPHEEQQAGEVERGRRDPADLPAAAGDGVGVPDLQRAETELPEGGVETVQLVEV